MTCILHHRVTTLSHPANAKLTPPRRDLHRAPSSQLSAPRAPSAPFTIQSTPPLTSRSTHQLRIRPRPRHAGTMSTPSPHSSTPDLSTTATTAIGNDPLSSGLQALLNPSIRTTTQKLSNVYLAQQELSGELERLVAQLQNYLEVTDPPVLRATVVKLVETRKRLGRVNNSLQTLQTRINRVYLVLSRARIPGGA
ncbi:hypothetical protein FPQ18DRAFT_354480 [Pyronema domesticum]|nr:hypothetical protein FPQ18DRAFT_354480 [Pyronema domesticum]